MYPSSTEEVERNSNCPGSAAPGENKIKRSNEYAFGLDDSVQQRGRSGDARLPQ
jgi:hypothetical protein